MLLLISSEGKPVAEGLEIPLSQPGGPTTLLPTMKTLLTFCILIIASMAWAKNPTVSNEGNCIKIAGGQNVNQDETDEVYLRKSAILYVWRHSKNHVEIRVSAGSYNYAFDTEEKAREFAKQIATWVVVK